MSNTRHHMLTLGMAALCLSILMLLSAVSAQCPHQQAGLVNFATLAGANVANSNVVVKQPVKISSSPTVRLRSITVASGGSLIFDNVNLSLNVSFIRVESNASFVMGSATCPLSSKIVVTFFGDRVNSSVNDLGADPFDGGKLGSKGIAFLSGSRVQIYGQVNGTSWTEIVSTAKNGTNTLQLRDSVKWRVGDSIVIASTDFGELYNYRTVTNASLNWARGEPFPDQNEERVVTQILNGGKTIVLDRPLNYTHFASADGKVRAEVGLLTRRIVFQGDESSEKTQFGGHMIIRSVQYFKVQGLEITRFGQQGLMGRYSLHFHLLQNQAASAPFGRDFFVKDCTVHHSYQRCYAVHDTNYILLQNNVCFDAFGHTYFLEDGSEIGNEFINNLGIRAKPVARENTDRVLIPSDADVSIFWITNPNNTFIGNHAVGGRFGFWFTMPTFPTGLSANRYAPGSINPRTAPPKPFDYNVAHSSNGNGLHIDDMEKPDGTSELAGYYPPAGYEALYTHFTAYKNRVHGVWARGALTFRNVYLSDNKNGFITPPGPNSLFDSTIIGFSDNVGLAYRSKVDLGGRSRHFQYAPSSKDIVSGYMTYDNGGPNYIRNVTFINFIPDQYHYSGALTQLLQYFKHQTRNRYTDLKFVNSNRFYVFNSSPYDNHRATAIMDMDGSITSVSPGAWITGNDTTMYFDKCTPKYEWSEYVCPFFGESYAQFRVINPNITNLNTTGSNGVDHPEIRNANLKVDRLILWDLLRDRFTNIKGALSQTNYYQQANVISRGFYAIRWPYDIPTPNNLTFFLDSSYSGDWILVAIQYPNNTQFAITMNVNSVVTNMTRTSSLANVINDPKNLYYYDASTEHLYLKVQNHNSKSSFKELYNFVDYYGAGVISVVAKCPKNNCAPKKFANPLNARSTYKSQMREDTFVGRLETCQQAAVKSLAAGSKAGSGNVYAFLNYNQRTLDFTLQHTLSSIATSIEIGTGALGTVATISQPMARISAYSQSRFSLMLSYDEWNSLLKGEMFVKVSTSENPTGHLRAQLYCNNATASFICQLPPAISAVKPCDSLSLKNSSSLVNIYQDLTSFSSEWSPYTYQNPSDDTLTVFNGNYTPAACGTSSAYMKIKKGSVSFNKIGKKLYIDSTYFKYFEFFVKSTNNTGTPDLRINFGYYNATSNKVIDFSRITVGVNYTQHFKIDSTRFTRVRIPISDIQFPEKVQNIHRLSFYLGDTSKARELIIDNMRFLGEVNTEATTRYITSSDIQRWGTKPTCGSTVNPDPDPLGIRKL
ncbi:hypothetical protein C9374_003197 [Naegleria lovaniensis]|uniref:G8 domain-containing protein n=1 Tax=Naegleria lovaniensis TaxID=51637 RepID=A0AA88KKR9_NAELO|nr:uncharacterized protein C9374_003197 [Naegleria lovaniensis]KAG2386048.1 hypothetical protein C9374_003197 [Naegleria lovaniensis]